MTITEAFAIIGIGLGCGLLSACVVLGGDMLRREWLRKRRWKRMERDVILSAQPEESPGRPGDPSLTLRMTEEEETE